MLKIELIPLLTDNYAYLIQDTDTHTTGIIDPSEGEPVLALLKEKNLSLDFILCTHHHWDHTNGNPYLKQQTGCKIVGYEGDAHRIKEIDITLKNNDIFPFGNTTFKVLHIPGHTTGHIAYYNKDNKVIFVGDTLFAMGCGRLFEGTPEQMYQSLQSIASLPDETKIYCGHEYTQTNSEFALTIEPNNQTLIDRHKEVVSARKNNHPTIPTTIALEKETNPFIRAGSVQHFAEIRHQKDNL